MSGGHFIFWFTSSANYTNNSPEVHIINTVIQSGQVSLIHSASDRGFQDLILLILKILNIKNLNEDPKYSSVSGVLDNWGDIVEMMAILFYFTGFQVSRAHQDDFFAVHTGQQQRQSGSSSHICL